MRSNLFITGSIFSVLALLATACGSTAGDTASTADSEEAISVASTTALPAPADAKNRLYFATPAFDWHSSDQMLTYRVFATDAGTEIKLGAVTLDANQNIDPTRAIGFKLSYLARSHGKLVWVPVPGLGSVDGKAGVASLRYTPDHARTYLMEVSAGFDDGGPLTVRSDLECSGGDASLCEVARQPGESCSAHGTWGCDMGLFCQLPAGTCGGQMGTCAGKPGICPLFVSYVCGCDGTTYDNTCKASSAGVNVAYSGKCN